MASLANDPGGTRRIIFFDRNKERKTIYLGKISKSSAQKIKTWVESIVAASIGGYSIDNETAEWLSKIADVLHAKLAGVGLVEPRQAKEPVQVITLGDFLESYIVGRTDVKPRTEINLRACKARLVEFFGESKPLDSITAGDAKDWEIWLKAQYARGTTARTIKRGKQFFAAAIDKELLGKNPFAKIKGGAQDNEARKHFVDLEASYKVLAACPDAEWRLLFALSRFGGLRCPSEHLGLTWADVDWERSRFRVRSPKTEHHEGKGERWVPIFPELRPYLEEAFDLAPEGTVYVVTRCRDAGVNLRTQLQRIIGKAGLTPWPKLWHNLRASRETELAASYPLHVVCTWIGNSTLIAQKHYLQVTEADFQKATRASSAPDSALAPKTAQNTAHHRATTEQSPNKKTPVLPGFSGEFPENCTFDQYPQGDSNTSQIHGENEESASGQRTTQRIFSEFGPDLARVVETWPEFPEATRRAILDLIECAMTPHDADRERGRALAPADDPERATSDA